MHTADLLEEALEVAHQLGYRVRHACLGTTTGGGCQIRGQFWLFLDPALPPDELLDQVVAAINAHPRVAAVGLSPELGAIIRPRKSA